jgi:hypothetical protein
MRRAIPIVLIMMAAIFAVIFVVALRAHAADIVGWDILENGLCEVALDHDGDGVAETSELHVVEWSGRFVLSDAALSAVGLLDRVWLFIVEEDNGEFIYAVQIAPLTLSTQDTALGLSQEEAL